MKKSISKNYILLVIISVVCLVILVFSASYAYFQTRIVNNNSNPLNVTAGSASLTISGNTIAASALAPIYDSTKDSKASIKTFTVKRSSDSTLAVCYNLYLVVDSISSNIKNSEYLKYEIAKGSSTATAGNFKSVTYGTDGKAYILLGSGNQLASTNTTGDTFTLKMWLSYSDSVDQTSLLGGSFSAHLYATGNTGTTCPSV